MAFPYLDDYVFKACLIPARISNCATNSLCIASALACVPAAALVASPAGQLPGFANKSSSFHHEKVFCWFNNGTGLSVSSSSECGWDHYHNCNESFSSKVISWSICWLCIFVTVSF
jgi:hypothetical protein